MGRCWRSLVALQNGKAVDFQSRRMWWTIRPCIRQKSWDSLFGIGSRGFVLALQLPQLAPAGVLFGFGGIGVFVALEPKPEPVHIALLGGHSLARFHKCMSPIREVEEFDGLIESL